MAGITVQVHKVPGWLYRRLVKKNCQNDGIRSGPWLLQNDPFTKHPWLDHWGTIKSTPQRENVFVSEPYSIGSRDIELIQEFCERHDLDFVITGGASHNHGCCRISFFPKQKPTTK